ncbi:MAG: hypothetical protein ABSC93_07010 [Bryobacteraceae bacterium]
MVPGDYIQFASSGALVEVAGHDGKAVAAQVAVREIFSAAAVRLLRGGVAGAVTVAGGVGQTIERYGLR